MTQEQNDILDTLIGEINRATNKANYFIKLCAINDGLDPEKVIFDAKDRVFRPKPENAAE
jgi:hypothetical protein